MTESPRYWGQDSKPPAKEPSCSWSSSLIPEDGYFCEMTGWSVSADGWKENGESYPPLTEGSVASGWCHIQTMSGLTLGIHSWLLREVPSSAFTDAAK